VAASRAGQKQSKKEIELRSQASEPAQVVKGNLPGARKRPIAPGLEANFDLR
jgi:hypothetical protein